MDENNEQRATVPEIAVKLVQAEDEVIRERDLKESAQNTVLKLQEEIKMSEAEKDSLRAHIDELKGELKRSREFTKKQYMPLLESSKRLKEDLHTVKGENGRLREENLQLNRYNSDLLVSERNLRAQIDELNANIDDREKRDITPTQMVAMMEAVFMRWSE